MGAENSYRGGAVVENGAIGSKRGCRGFMGPKSVMRVVLWLKKVP